MKNKSTSRIVTLSKVFKYLKNYRPVFILSIILTFASVALTLWLPILTGDAIDCLIKAGDVDFEGLFRILTIMAVVILSTALINWIIGALNNRMTYNIVRNIRNNAFEKIQKLPLSYIDSHPTGECVSRIISDVEQFADGLLMGFTQLLSGFLTIIGTIIFMLSLNVSITVIVILLTPISLFIAAFIAKKTYSMFKLQSSTRAEQTSLIDEMISGHKVVVAFGHEAEAQKDFEQINQKLGKCSLRAIFYSSTTNPSTRFVNSLVYTSVALVGAMLCVGGSSALSVGMLASFLSYANQYTKPFNEISGVVTELQNALASASRIFELIDEMPETPDNKDAESLSSVDGTVDICNVDFSYVPEKPLIRDFNLNVKSGQKIAIVGPTGSGKTTLINLIMRFYDVNEGEIKVDGKNIRNITRKSLRRNYGMVLQDTWLKAGTIRDNIIIGKPDATDEEIVEAAKASHAHSFIKRLPEGYNTYIGEDGGMLSQGQKQLLSITRVMLCLPPMLILDEATSSIDTRTEIKIQEAFTKMMNGRTSFIVAHRLSTIRKSDIILVMDKGNIIEQGTHEELLQKRGFYYNLYQSQFNI